MIVSVPIFVQLLFITPYSPKCVEVSFFEVELPLYGVLRSSDAVAREAWFDARLQTAAAGNISFLS